MASNLIVARGGVEFVPPISLAFWRWLFVFSILLPFTFFTIKKNLNIVKKEIWKLLFLGSMGCGVCGAFPFIAGKTTTIINMGIIYTSSPIFIILISTFFFGEKINKFKIFHSKVVNVIFKLPFQISCLFRSTIVFPNLKIF